MSDNDKMREYYDRLAKLAEKQEVRIKELEGMVAMLRWALTILIPLARGYIKDVVPLNSYMSTKCEQAASVATATQATAQAYEAEIKAKALEEAGEGWDTRVDHSAGTIRTALRRMAQDIRATSKKG